MRSAAWLTLVILYVVWNLTAYLSRELYGTNILLYDYSYWINERVFVVGTWVVIYKMMWPKWEKYRWIVKSFICVAILKLGYLLAVVSGLIKANYRWEIMGTIFIVTLGFILEKWERLRQNL